MLRNSTSRAPWGAFAAAACLSAATPAIGQSQLYEFFGAGTEDRFGVSVAAAGDVNNDGHMDLVVGAPEDFNVFLQQPGYIRVYSGLDGATLLAVPNASGINGEKFGRAVDGVGDVNHDGRDDLIVGVPSQSSNGAASGEARVLSGLNGSLIFSVKGDASGHELGTSVSGAGDVNNDGTPDFVVGIPGVSTNGSNCGAVRVYSGTSGLMLWQRTGLSTSNRLGYSVDAFGDLNNDGFDDVLVGSYYEGVYVLSGVDGSVLRHWTSTNTSDFLGYSVKGIGDVTGDSIPDCIAGAIQPTVFVPTGAGYAKVINGATGAQVHLFSGLNVGDLFGYSVDVAGDYDGDGMIDYLVSALQDSGGNPGYVQVLSGFDGGALLTLTGSGTDAQMGRSVAYLGDVNGDGTYEFAAGSPLDSTNLAFSGRVVVRSGGAPGCLPPSNYCTATANSTGAPAAISYLGTNSVANNDLFLFATGLPPSQTGVFYYGPQATSFAFGNGVRCVGGGTVYRLPVTITGPGGVTAWQLDITSPPEASGQITAGSTWYFQYWFRDPSGGGSNFNLSNGLKVPFCP
ncbi:MAG: FG-GAP repeat protein [Planctomycetes bacterium]|nr:FG-GAP repeat protein [Planctomycetota bacterium]